MTLVEIYSSPGCHLCEEAKELLSRVRETQPFELREVLVIEGDRAFEQYRERVPVIFINREFAFQYRIPEREFIARLERSAGDEMPEEPSP